MGLLCWSARSASDESLAGPMAARLAPRLEHLPHDVLAELAAEALAACPQLQRKAERSLALHAPVPAWAVSSVLLDPDLLPCMMASLRLEEGAAALCQLLLIGLVLETRLTLDAAVREQPGGARRGVDSSTFSVAAAIAASSCHTGSGLGCEARVWAAQGSRELRASLPVKATAARSESPRLRDENLRGVRVRGRIR